MKVDRKETLRYLGCQGQEIDSQTERLLNEVAEELERDSAPKSVYQEFPCKTEGDEVLIGGYRIKSANLAKNLEGCGYAVLLAATVGRAADFMVKKYSIISKPTWMRYRPPYKKKPQSAAFPCARGSAPVMVILRWSASGNYAPCYRAAQGLGLS